MYYDANPNGYNRPYDFLPMYYNGDSFTEEVYIKPTTLPEHKIGILSQENSHEILMDTSGDIGFAYYDDLYTYTDEPSDPVLTLVINTWYHIALVYDSTVPSVQVFIDAVSVYTKEIQLNFMIGKHNPISHSSVAGQCGAYYVTNYRFWNVVMDDAELAVVMLE